MTPSRTTTVSARITLKSGLGERQRAAAETVLLRTFETLKVKLSLIDNNRFDVTWTGLPETDGEPDPFDAELAALLKD